MDYITLRKSFADYVIKKLLKLEDIKNESELGFTSRKCKRNQKNIMRVFKSLLKH